MPIFFEIPPVKGVSFAYVRRGISEGSLGKKTKNKTESVWSPK